MEIIKNPEVGYTDGAPFITMSQGFKIDDVVSFTNKDNDKENKKE